MSLFTSDPSTILEEPKWLEPLSDPPGGRPLCRDADLKLIASHLTDLFKTGQARNIFIHGGPGTGKTLCVKHVLSEVARHNSENHGSILTAYVNAGKTRTPYYTMAEIVKQLGVNVPSAGWQMFRLKHAFENLLTDKSALIAIDEVDSIIFKEKEPLVYYLSRQPKTTLILISNRLDDVVKLPERTLSTLQPILIHAEPYTPEEIGQIFKERVERAFKPETISDVLLTMIAKTASKVGDVRFGLRVLLTAALLAEKAGRQRTEAADIASAVKEENKTRKFRELEVLRDNLLKLKKKYEKD
jgi:Cdc6-like AAA superfamily ATPase